MPVAQKRAEVRWEGFSRPGATPPNVCDPLFLPGGEAARAKCPAEADKTGLEVARKLRRLWGQQWYQR